MMSDALWQDHQIAACAYHGGMSDAERAEVQLRWATNDSCKVHAQLAVTLWVCRDIRIQYAATMSILGSHSAHCSGGERSLTWGGGGTE